MVNLDIPVAATNKYFAHWIDRFRPKAMRNGISRSVFELCFENLHFNNNVIEHDRKQPEIVRQIWDYLDVAVSKSRIKNGRAVLGKYRHLLHRVENKYGVAPEILVAIWGLESAYGACRGDYPVIGALATLACDARRAGVFEAQLIAALHIIQDGDVLPDEMIGSWAGAMGHTQLMPTTYRAYAVDFDGDGARRIWGEDPCDALASSAAFLAAIGWQPSTPELIEVFLPADFDFAFAGLDVVKGFDEWQNLGVCAVQNLADERDLAASILAPAGACGPMFAIFENFRKILQYNPAIPYGLAVAHLATRIKGGSAFSAPWPRDEPTIARHERTEIQQRLCAAGYDTKGVDGIFGPDTFAALRRFQIAENLIADGFATRQILHRLRK